jgi:acid phosphatase family membrane protein YuiD
MTPILYSVVAAWALSQLFKVVIAFVRIGRGESARLVWRLVWAGGMPSSHSAAVASTLLMVALIDGPRSSLFGVAFVVAAIVVYDRAKMHHLYQVFQSRYSSLAEAAREDPKMKDLVGHTIGEIVVGILIGFVAAALTWALWGKSS